MTDSVFIGRPLLSRRRLLQTVSSGFGWLAFSGLASRVTASSVPLAPKPPHFKPRAKQVIFLCMRGGPSHVDTFEHKPQLNVDNGREVKRGRRGGKLLGSPWEFRRYGQGGLWISELFPKVAQQADKLCMLHGMHTDFPAHPQAFVQMHTGSSQFVRPSMGAWTLYGLGTRNENLPGFITLSPPLGLGGARNYGSAFLPAAYQATPIGRERRSIASAKINNISNTRLSGDQQKIQLDFIQDLNRNQALRDMHSPGIEGVIQSFELAFRMQSEVPELMDLSKEPQSVQNQYGLDKRDTANFGRQCLLARRMVEAGVRFVEVCQGNWDHHRNLRSGLERNCFATDQPIAALLDDLHKRGLLEETLVIWGGEFGRTPHAQNDNGRDHNNKGFTMWLAGGGVKGGFAHGSTDEHGYQAEAGKIHIHDWHATILYLLGLDHEQLTYRYAGRDFRLTDINGEVVHQILA